MERIKDNKHKISRRYLRALIIESVEKEAEKNSNAKMVAKAISKAVKVSGSVDLKNQSATATVKGPKNLSATVKGSKDNIRLTVPLTIGAEKVTLNLSVPPEDLQGAFQGKKSKVNLNGTVGKGSDKKSVSVVLDPNLKAYTGNLRGKNVGFDIKFDAKKNVGSTGAQFKLADMLPASKLTPDSLKIGTTHSFDAKDTNISLGISKDFKFNDGKLTTSISGKAGVTPGSEKSGFVNVTYKPKSKKKNKGKISRTLDKHGVPLVTKYADTKSGGLKKTKDNKTTKIKSDIDSVKKKVKVNEMKLTRKQLVELVLESTELKRHLTNTQKSLDSLQNKLMTSVDKEIHILEINDVLRNIVEYLLEKSKLENT
jgi:hypothetical protein|tara:strand:+ start:4353 stop:5459 length:1107 start_codon:yes stop_codon:yes gene_type:complete